MYMARKPEQIIMNPLIKHPMTTNIYGKETREDNNEWCNGVIKSPMTTNMYGKETREDNDKSCRIATLKRNLLVANFIL